MERVFEATLEELWELWTTQDGIESWWGPEGFQTSVQRLELRVGGALEYSFTAVGAEQIEFMRRSGQPLTQSLKATYSALETLRLAAWQNVVDFIPQVTPYEVETRIELRAEPNGRVHLGLFFDVMHEEYWTGLATQGWESELGKLGRVIEQRRKK